MSKPYAINIGFICPNCGITHNTFVDNHQAVEAVCECGQAFSVDIKVTPKESA